MMTLQTVLIRLGGLSFGSSQFTFSMVVAVFVLCIALGSFAVSALPRIPAAPAARLPLGPAAAARRALRAGRHGTVLGACAAQSLPRRGRPASIRTQFQAFLGVLLVLGLPVALSGAVLPLMFHALRERVTNLGDVAGRLYSWNTLGSLLGALLGGYALLFWLDLHHTYRIAMAAIALAAMLATLRSLDAGRLAPALILALRRSAQSRCCPPGTRSASRPGSSAPARRSRRPFAARRPSSAARSRASCASTTTIRSLRSRSRRTPAARNREQPRDPLEWKIRRRDPRRLRDDRPARAASRR